MTQPLTIAAGGIWVEIKPVPGRQPEPGGDATSTWVAHVHVGKLVAVLAPSLDIIAHQAELESQLAIAPAGGGVLPGRRLPGKSIAINAMAANQVDRHPVNGENDAMTSFLIRVFPRDIAAFVFRDGRIVLPGWAQVDSRPD